jgi:hypothetical protein
MTIYTYRLSIYDDSNLLIIRHSRSYGDFTKKISPHLVSLIKVEGLFSPYFVTNFDIVGLALHVFEAFIEQIKPILLSHTC